ncbi:protein NDNF-like isoform X2 [Pseudophryne corroboree]
MEKLLLILSLTVYSTFQNHVGQAFFPLDSNHITDVRRALPVGHRVDGFLSVDKPLRYYFTVSRSQRTVTVRVTPCESPILWTLSVLPTHDYSEQLVSWKHHQQRGPQQIFSFKGNGEESFSSTVTSGAFYFLDFISLESDTNLEVFVWDHADAPPPWPQLPTDPRVDVLSVEENKVELSWRPSLGPAEAELEYCVFVNRRHNFKTLCATELNSKKEPESHHNIQNTKSKKLLNTNTEKSSNKVYSYPKAYKSLKVPGVVDENDNLWSFKTLPGSQRVCVGTSANATIYGLKPRSLYYIDVFAVNPRDGTSMAYTGTFAETKPKHKSQILKVPNDEMVNIFLKSKGVKIMTIEPSTHGFKWLFVHSCLHKVHIQIMVNGQIEVSQSLQGAHNFKLVGNSKHNFIISLKSSKGGPGLVKLFATSTHTHLPFSNLPPDINMSVSKRSCSSATVSWTGSGQGAKYCVYVRHLEQNLDLRLIQKHQNSCLSTSSRSRAEKVVCRQEGSQPLTEEHITDLKPGKAYLIDLYFIGLHNNTIKFPSHVLKTQDWCT